MSGSYQVHHKDFACVRRVCVHVFRGERSGVPTASSHSIEGKIIPFFVRNHLGYNDVDQG